MRVFLASGARLWYAVGKDAKRRDDAMTQTERIAYYEEILNRAAAAAERLDAALEEFEAAQPQVRELDAYYGAADWRADLAADEAGKLPDGLRRGVLSEDAAWDALCANRALLRRMRELAERYL